MKAGILTFHCGNQNYGATLQAAVLQRQLVSMGYDARIIDFVPWRLVLLGFCRALRRGELKAFFFRSRAQRKFLKSEMLHRVSLLRGVRHAMRDFRILVSGSDEVWKINYFRGFRPVYFLDGVPGAGKISYAASVVASPAFSRREAQIRPLLLDYRHLSVRESATAQIVYRLTGRMPEIVLDPTLAFDTLSHVPETGRSGFQETTPFLFLYSETFFEPAVCEALLDYARYRGLRILSFNRQRCMHPDSYLQVSPDIPGFLQYMQNAHAVVTDTYHGICLAAVMHRNFVSLMRPHKAYKMIWLLDLLNLSRRNVSEPSRIAPLLDEEIAWQAVDARLAQERARSLQFLTRALADAA